MPKYLIQVTREGIKNHPDKKKVIQAQDFFRHYRYLKLPYFVAPDLCKELVASINAGKFFRRVHKNIAVELCMRENRASHILRFAVNDRALFQFVQKVTACRPIGCFTGRVYRMESSEHHDDWHNDMTDYRMIALSVNLGKGVYQGGHLHLRHIPTQTIHKITNTRPGDAVIFYLHRDYEHYVENVRGKTPKIAYAGWFRSQPDFFKFIRKRLSKNRQPLKVP